MPCGVFVITAKVMWHFWTALPSWTRATRTLRTRTRSQTAFTDTLALSSGMNFPNWKVGGTNEEGNARQPGKLRISLCFHQFIYFKGLCALWTWCVLHSERITRAFLQDAGQARQKWPRASTWLRDLLYIQLAPNIKPNIAQLQRAPCTAAIEMSCNSPSKYYITWWEMSTLSVTGPEKS